MNIIKILNKLSTKGATLSAVSFIESPVQKVTRTFLAKLAVSMGVGSCLGSYLKQKNVQPKTIIKYSTITASALAIGAASCYFLPTTQKILSLKALGHLKRSLLHTATFVTGALLPSVHHLVKSIFELMQKAYNKVKERLDTPIPEKADPTKNSTTTSNGSLSDPPDHTNQTLALPQSSNALIISGRVKSGEQLNQIFKINPEILRLFLRNPNLLKKKDPIIVTIKTSLKTVTFRINPKTLARFFRSQNGLLRNPSYQLPSPAYRSLPSSEGNVNSWNIEPAGYRIQEITEEPSYLDLIKDALKELSPKSTPNNDEYVIISLTETELQQRISSTFLPDKKIQIDSGQVTHFQGDIEKDADLKGLINKIPDLRGLAQEIQDYIAKPETSLEDLAIQLVCAYNKKLVNIFEVATKKVPGSDELTLAGDALMSLQKNTKLHIAIQNLYNYLNSDEAGSVPPELAITLLYYFSFFCKKTLQDTSRQKDLPSFLKKIRTWWRSPTNLSSS